MNAPARQAVATIETPPGRGGIAVLVLSGPDAGEILRDVFRPSTDAHEGELRLGRLFDDAGNLDEAIVARRGQSFEINLHGGPVAVRAILMQLTRLGARVAACTTGCESFPLAHPRWSNPAVGAELLEALQSARSPLAVSAVSRQWSAGLSELADRPTSEVSATLRTAAARLPQMRRLLNPAEVVLAGPPNAGKSTLANLLVGRAVSIVDDTPGTTRDWVRELAIIDGAPVWLTDTAGLWQPADALDAEAVERARACIAAAELVVLMQAGDAPQVPDWLDASKVLTVAAKADIAPPRTPADVTLSARGEQGVEELRREIVRRLGLGEFDPSAPAAFTDRQAALLTQAADALDRADAPAAKAALDQLLNGRQLEAD